MPSSVTSTPSPKPGGISPESGGDGGATSAHAVPPTISAAQAIQYARPRARDAAPRTAQPRPNR